MRLKEVSVALHLLVRFSKLVTFVAASWRVRDAITIRRLMETSANVFTTVNENRRHHHQKVDRCLTDREPRNRVLLTVRRLDL